MRSSSKVYFPIDGEEYPRALSEHRTTSPRVGHPPSSVAFDLDVCDFFLSQQPQRVCTSFCLDIALCDFTDQKVSQGPGLSFFSLLLVVVLSRKYVTSFSHEELERKSRKTHACNLPHPLGVVETGRSRFWQIHDRWRKRRIHANMREKSEQPERQKQGRREVKKKTVQFIVLETFNDGVMYVPTYLPTYVRRYCFSTRSKSRADYAKC